jgi:hypothetical protein
MYETFGEACVCGAMGCLNFAGIVTLSLSISLSFSKQRPKSISITRELNVFEIEEKGSRSLSLEGKGTAVKLFGFFSDLMFYSATSSECDKS